MHVGGEEDAVGPHAGCERADGVGEKEREEIEERQSVEKKGGEGRIEKDTDVEEDPRGEVGGVRIDDAVGLSKVP